MILLSTILANLIIIAAEVNLDTGYCDTLTDSCNTLQNDDTKFLFYDVNPAEGFNLRRDVYMRFAIMLTEAKKSGKMKNWQLVLPPWHNLYHWKTDSFRRKPKHWRSFFDVKSLKSYAPVMELHEVFSELSAKHLQIDTLYVLQNFENPFEDGDFRDKWELSGDNCDYNGKFWGYNNITVKEIICVKFQGRISMLSEIISVHPLNSKVMFAHGEIPLHDKYGTKSYWDCRKSMKFNSDLVKIATDYISNNFKCEIDKCGYVSVHWRRQDFSRSRNNDVPSITGTAKQINEAAKKNVPEIKNIFIASDASPLELSQLENELKNYQYNVYFYLPTIDVLNVYKDGAIAIIDQIISAHSAFFIGTHESTFSYRIQEEREILGFDSSTTFNRLCPDSGHCEKPSQWTIVH